MSLHKLQKIIDEHNVLLIPTASNKIDYWYDILQFLLPKCEVINFPEWDVDVFSLLSPSNERISQRLTALQKLLSRLNKPLVIVTSYSCLLQKLPPKDIFIKNNINLRVGDEVDRELILMSLVDNNYIRSDEVMNIGEFAVRGSIIDIASNCGEHGYRIDFFGDKIERIKKFNFATQLSFAEIKNVELFTASEISFDEKSKQIFYNNYKERFGALPRQLKDAMENGVMWGGIEHYLPLFHQNLSSIVDYLPEKAALLLSDNSKLFLQNLYQDKLQDYKNQKDYLALLSIEEWFKEPNYLESICHKIYDIVIESITAVQHNYNFYQQSLKQNKSPFELLGDVEKNTQIVIAAHSKRSVETLELLLGSRQINFEKVDNIKEVNSSVSLAKINISKGFVIDNGAVCNSDFSDLATGTFSHKTVSTSVHEDLRTKATPSLTKKANMQQSHNICIVTEDELLGEKLTGIASKTTDTHRAIDNINQIKNNDYIVHKSYGVGIFAGLEELKINNIIRDFIKIIYEGNDKIYLPVENLDLISKYSDENNPAKLDKLGGTVWQKRQAMMKKRIKIAAEKFIEIAAKRKSISAPIFNTNNEFYEIFCSSFKFIETEDQLSSIRAVESDLRQGYPMDRLICGDVGFGKTEVAMRACCLVAASEHKTQVAIIVPTTLLCLQHFNTFTDRFKNIPVNIEMLCKMNTPTQNRDIKKRLAEGLIDIVITTHSIFARDIKFANLGLAIIDEEQHFGVKQKEKIKDLQNNVHLLTLSATPIPRTLQMSISGIKELSLIMTPPTNRKEIKTNILPFNKQIIVNAINAECERNGRIFFVTPRISYIKEITGFLDEYLPHIKYDIAHGQINSKDLEDTVTKFYRGEISILISTNIIESGIDIPNANTLIVDRAELFGLAQLYQIRGRIGRGSLQAYAYLTLSKKIKFNSKVHERIEVLKSLSHFGGGLAVANHDSDLRGYGNLLGEEQSGHIKEVGVELYNQMLQEAIVAMQRNNQGQSEEYSPVINLGISIQIPTNYVDNEKLRLSLYRKVANVQNEEELVQLQQEITDRFGPPPEEVKHLFDTIKIKILAKKAKVTKLDVGDGCIFVAFHKVVEQHSDKIFQLIKHNPQKVKVKPNNKIQFMTKTATDVEKINSTISLLNSCPEILV